MRAKPAFETEINFDDDGYLVIAQTVRDEYPTVRLSPDQVARLRAFLVGTKYEQLNAWNSDAGEG